jgi:phosphopantothenoylcysteine decarboxylase / phosphopantothenate---cysteine ligase
MRYGMCMTKKRVLLIVGGGISAYKTPEIVRQLDKAGIETRVILTAAGGEFVSALTLASLTRDTVYTQLFDLTSEAKMGHIELSRSADLVVVAPATADLMAKVANGSANDLASTALLATDKPVMMAPAMNVRMWEHPAVVRNVATLRGDGVLFIGPDEGAMACGEFGPGRMAEPSDIVAAVKRFFADEITPKHLTGRHILITAGPTVEAIDPVRFLSNRSSGKQGYAIAKSLAVRGAQVTLVSGPTALPAPAGVTLINVESAIQMLEACQQALPADAFIGVAAVADWRPSEAGTQKLKLKTETKVQPLALIENPDILATMAKVGPSRPQLVIGFAAETHDVIAYAQGKLAKKNCDWIIANDVSGDVMGGNHNSVSLVSADGVEDWPRLDKRAVAEKLATHIAAHFAKADPVS